MVEKKKKKYLGDIKFLLVFTIMLIMASVIVSWLVGYLIHGINPSNIAGSNDGWLGYWGAFLGTIVSISAGMIVSYEQSKKANAEEMNKLSIKIKLEAKRDRETISSFLYDKHLLDSYTKLSKIAKLMHKDIVLMAGFFSMRYENGKTFGDKDKIEAEVKKINHLLDNFYSILFSVCDPDSPIVEKYQHLFCSLENIKEHIKNNSEIIFNDEIDRMTKGIGAAITNLNDQIIIETKGTFKKLNQTQHK